RKIHPQMNVFSFDRLTRHEAGVGKFFLNSQNQFGSGETHRRCSWIVNDLCHVSALTEPIQCGERSLGTFPSPRPTPIRLPLVKLKLPHNLPQHASDTELRSSFVRLPRRWVIRRVWPTGLDRIH